MKVVLLPKNILSEYNRLALAILKVSLEETEYFFVSPLLRWELLPGIHEKLPLSED